MKKGDNRSYTEQLAEFIQDLEYDHLPRNAVDMGKRALLDFLGCALSGYHSDSSQILLRYLREQGGTPEASIVITGEKTTCSHAALAHGTMASSTELDDLQPRGGSCHAGEAVIPVVMAVAEKDHKSGKEAIVAIVAGYEAGVRVGAAKTPEAALKGISGPALSGPFGAAAAASKLYGLEKKKIGDAFGLCFPQLVPLGAFKTGVLAKDIKGGLASWLGLFSANLAKEGIEGLKDNLDRRQDRMGDVLSRILGRYEEERIVQDLGEEFEIVQTGFKPFATCGFTHAPLTGVFEILKETPILPEDVEKINVRSFKLALEMNNAEPPTSTAARISIPYTIACALVNHSAMPEVFTEKEIRDPRKRELARKVQVIWDPVYDAEWSEKHGCSVEIVTRGGKIFRKEVRVMKGHPDLPLTEKEIIEKFERLSIPSLGKQRVRALIDKIFSLEELSDMNDLVRLLHK